MAMSMDSSNGHSFLRASPAVGDAAASHGEAQAPAETGVEHPAAMMFAAMRNSVVESLNMHEAHMQEQARELPTLRDRAARRYRTAWPLAALNVALGLWCIAAPMEWAPWLSYAIGCGALWSAGYVVVRSQRNLRDCNSLIVRTRGALAEIHLMRNRVAVCRLFNLGATSCPYCGESARCQVKVSNDALGK